MDWEMFKTVMTGLCLCIFSAQAQMTGPFTYEVREEFVTISGCEQSVRNVMVPETIKGLPVTKIGKTAFWNCRSLTNCVLPSCITDIGNGAFAGCDSLKNIVLPEGVVRLGNDAFFGCDSLTGIHLPESLESIGSGAFIGCAQWTGLESIRIPPGVSYIGPGAFRHCRVSSLIVDDRNPNFSSSGDVLFKPDRTELLACLRGKAGTYVVPKSVTHIGDVAFAGCSQLKEVVLPPGLMSIGRGAFDQCGKLETLNLPPKVERIGERAFVFCKSLASIEVEEGNGHFRSFDGVLFNEDKTKLAACPKTLTGTYTVPDGIIAIGESAFSDCTALKKIMLPDGLRDIGTYAFASCYSLEEIIFPAGVSNMGDDVFSCCGKLKKVTFRGDAPEKIGATVFFGAHPELKIHCRENAAGFNGYSWSGKALVRE